jgi:hypothetical protein
MFTDRPWRDRTGEYMGKNGAGCGSIEQLGRPVIHWFGNIVYDMPDCWSACYGKQLPLPASPKTYIWVGGKRKRCKLPSRKVVI